MRYSNENPENYSYSSKKIVIYAYIRARKPPKDKKLKIMVIRKPELTGPKYHFSCFIPIKPT
jgi:hypothetical protein